MSAIVELHPHAAAQARARELTSAIGMVVALSAFAMLFACLFFMYAGLRSQALAWPPPGLPSLPVLLPLANTGVIAASSATLWRAGEELSQRRQRRATALLAATFVLGALFVALQLVLWRGLWQVGITLRTGALGTVVYALTSLHALHVVGGLVALGYLLVQALRDRLGHSATTLRLSGMYWHFVGIVWGLMFVGMFLI